MHHAIIVWFSYQMIFSMNHQCYMLLPLKFVYYLQLLLHINIDACLM